MSVATSKRIENAFTFHPAREGQPERYQSIRDRAKDLAHYISSECPESRELNTALKHLEEAVFWANAAIARNE